MVRVALLFLVIAALAVLVLSNLSPIALTILGMRTLALPLGLWVAGAIGAGAVTTVILSGLLRLARPGSSSTASRRPNPRNTNRFSPNAFRTPWTADSSRQSPQAATPQAATSSSYTDAFARRTTESTSSSNAKAAWDDWTGYPPTDRQPEPRTQVRDTEDDDWANWEGYEDLERDRSNPQQNRQSSNSDSDFDGDFDFDDVEDDRLVDRPPGRPARTDFEVRRDPQTRQQSGSVYSYSYRRSEDEPEPAKPTAKPGEVYDADYRVITPPYHPDPEAVIPPPDRPTESHDSVFTDDRTKADSDKNSNDDDEDWI